MTISPTIARIAGKEGRTCVSASSQATPLQSYARNKVFIDTALDLNLDSKISTDDAVRAPSCPSPVLGVKSQLDYLQQGLPGYGQFGVSRKGFEDATDEFCTIFYDKEKVEFLEGGTFWLSDSPSIPGSISWGAKSPCIATWATFQMQGIEPPGFSFQIVNTNMDEFSPRARRRSALLTWQHIASLPSNLPVVYSGGFNAQKESSTGRFLFGRSREHGMFGDMRDAWANARVRTNVSLIRTHHGFKGNKQGTVEFLKLILMALCLCWDRQTQDLHKDWILFRGRGLIPVHCEVVNDNIDGHYPSSHYPIYAEFMLPRSVRYLEQPSVVEPQN